MLFFNETICIKYILKTLEMNNFVFTSTDIVISDRSKLFANKDKMISKYKLITYADGKLIASSNYLGLFLSELIKSQVINLHSLVYRFIKIR